MDALTVLSIWDTDEDVIMSLTISILNLYYVNLMSFENVSFGCSCGSCNILKSQDFSSAEQLIL